MTDKVSVVPGFGCAPLPLSTGRIISQRLPFLEYRSPKSNVTLWLSRENVTYRKSTAGVLKPLFVDIPNKQHFPSIDGNDLQFRVSTKHAQQLLHYGKGNQRGIDGRRTVTSDGHRWEEGLALDKSDAFRRHTAPEPARAYTPFVTPTRPRTCESWSSENLYSGRTSVDPESLRSSSRAGLSRYTPLPAIGQIGRVDGFQEGHQLAHHHSLNSLDQDTWNFPDLSTPTSDRKLPPILRPLVRSRTFTILNFEGDGEQSWTMDERDEEEEVSRPVSRSLDLFLMVTTPDGVTEENHFDSEDTFRDVFRFVFKEREEDEGEWRFVTDDEVSPQVFTDFTQTLADARVQSKTKFLLQRTSS